MRVIGYSSFGAVLPSRVSNRCCSHRFRRSSKRVPLQERSPKRAILLALAVLRLRLCHEGLNSLELPIGIGSGRFRRLQLRGNRGTTFSNKPNKTGVPVRFLLRAVILFSFEVRYFDEQRFAPAISPARVEGAGRGIEEVLDTSTSLRVPTMGGRIVKPLYERRCGA